LITSFGLALLVLVGSWSVTEDHPLVASGSLDPLTQGSVDITVDEIIASGFTRPIQVTNAGDGSHRLFVVEQTGTVRIIES
jgi:hypothetical protein